jgi:hypothetical protein
LPVAALRAKAAFRPMDARLGGGGSPAAAAVVVSAIIAAVIIVVLIMAYFLHAFYIIF